MNEDWLHKIHDRMSEYETDAPDRLWEAIEEKLAPAAGGQRPARRRTILIRVRRSLAAAAMLTLAISLCFYLLDGNKKTDLRPMMSAHAPTASYPTQHDVPSGIISKQPASIQAPQPTPTAVTSEKILAEVTEQPHGTADTSSTGHSTMPAAIPVTDGNDSLSTHSVERAHTSSPLPVRRGAADNRRKIGQSARNLSIAMFSSGATGSMSTRRSPAYLSGAPLGADYASWKDTPMLGLMLFNKGRRLDTKVRHNIPVRAGITVDYSLNRRISLESGISYAYLSSDITEGSDHNYYEGRQRLHYIGIPLNIKYRILSWGRIGLYASAGVLAEKCVSARIEKHFIFDHVPNGTTTESLSERPMQWSVNVGAGLQCRLAGAARLFAEPGVSYYFNDGTKIPTVYSDKPLNFNLNLGVRFTLGE